MSERGERAKELFCGGYNCSQAVIIAFSDLTVLDEKTGAKLGSCFGGGMGRMREVCGAVTGMFTVYGLVNGYCDAKDNEKKKQTYAAVQELAEKFREENGSIICKELLGLEKPEGTHIPSQRTEEYYKKRPCSDIVRLATEILENKFIETGIL